MPKYRVKGWVEVEVYATIEAKNLNHAKKLFKDSEGNGVADGFDYEEGNWVSRVNLESIEKEK